MSTIVNRSSSEVKPYGTLEVGTIDYGRDSRLAYTRGIPSDPISDTVFILETGLASGVESLALPRDRLCELGYTALTIGHLHTNALHPIKRNAVDIKVVADIFATSSGYHGVGLSRGWGSQVYAAREESSGVKSLTAVAPAMMSGIRLERLPILGFEIAKEFHRNPAGFGRVLVDGARTIATRPHVTVTEAIRLPVQTVHKELQLLEGEVDLHMIAFPYDCFFRHDELRKLSKILGFKSFKLFNRGTSGHLAMSYDPRVSDTIAENVFLKDQIGLAA